MSQKTDLQSNNTDLQAILATINALPSAGGGGSSEAVVHTVTLDVYNDLGWSGGGYIYYINAEGNVAQIHIDSSDSYTGTITLPTGLIILGNLLTGSFESWLSIEGDIECVSNMHTCAIFHVNGSGSISV